LRGAGQCSTSVCLRKIEKINLVDVMIACGDVTAATPQLPLLVGFILFPAKQSVQ